MRKIIKHLSRQAREKRAVTFRNNFNLKAQTRILDIGSEDGSNIANILQATPVLPENVYIADINQEVLDKGKEKYGFKTVLLNESGQLPFEDQYFDIVYCSSVIEHVTIPKEEIWSCKSPEEFRRRSWIRQKGFAAELQRLGKQYFVQTPNKWFLIESHTWLPFMGWLPRNLVIPAIRAANKVWIKSTTPDWNLLTVSEMRELFPEATLELERVAGMVKSIMAIYRSDN